MSQPVGAGDPPQLLFSDVEDYPESQFDSSPLFARVNQSIRENHLHKMKVKKHLYLMKKALGLPTETPPFSFVPDSLIDDSTVDFGCSSSEEAGGAGRATCEGSGEMTMSDFSEPIPETIRSSADLGLVDSEEADPGLVDSERVDLGSVDSEEADLGFVDSEEADGGDWCFGAEAMMYDRARAAELHPDTVTMMRLLLPRYFEMVRSFLVNSFALFALFVCCEFV